MAWESPTIPWNQCSPERQAALRVAWGSGNLRWKLDPSQAQIYDQIYASHKTVRTSFERVFCMDLARQTGKDFLMSVIGVETCLRRRCRTRIPYGAPTKETVHELLVPTMEAIFEDCPPELLPHELKGGTFRSNAPELNWDWGAFIKLVGVDLHPDWLRGPATYAILLTEPAFMDALDHIMTSVLMPQLITKQEGFVIMGSTPPESPGHPWSTKYIPKAKTRGMYAMRTIEQNPRLSPEQIEAAIEELGGRQSTSVRRELFCEHIIESTLAAVPEYSEVKSVVVTEEGFDKPPPFRDTYVSIDPGFDHATGALFAYMDFNTATVMIEGDINLRYQNSRQVARAIKAREWQLWGFKPVMNKTMTARAQKEELDAIMELFYPDMPIPTKPVASHRDGQLIHRVYRRVSDTDSRLIADMSTEHNIIISPTEKDDAEAALNAFRVKLQGLKYRIHPRCVHFIAHLEQATWNKHRTKLAKCSDGGHFDTIPAAVYLNRNIIWGRNPNPPQTVNRFTHHTPKRPPTSRSARQLDRLFKR